MTGMVGGEFRPGLKFGLGEPIFPVIAIDLAFHDLGSIQPMFDVIAEVNDPNVIEFAIRILVFFLWGIKRI